MLIDYTDRIRLAKKDPRNIKIKDEIKIYQSKLSVINALQYTCTYCQIIVTKAAITSQSKDNDKFFQEFQKFAEDLWYFSQKIAMKEWNLKKDK